MMLPFYRQKALVLALVYRLIERDVVQVSTGTVCFNLQWFFLVI